MMLGSKLQLSPSTSPQQNNYLRKPTHYHSHRKIAVKPLKRKEALWIDYKDPNQKEDGTPFRFTGKERDLETGLYYYGARYLDPKTSRWMSTDPAMYQGDYIPGAPVDDEARKRNGNLPGQGGIFNYVNMHVYHYAGNNPVKYVDPNGENPKTHMEIFTRLTTSYEKPKLVEKINNKYIYNTTVKTILGNINATFSITNNGEIEFNFADNDYFGILIRGGDEALAKAMYETALSVNPKALSGRTAGGIDTELKLHYLVYEALDLAGMQESDLFKSAKKADMGGIFKGQPGHDKNAIFSQGIQARKTYLRFTRDPNLWTTFTTIEELMGYIK